MSSNRLEMLGGQIQDPISSVRTTLETMPQEESQLDTKSLLSGFSNVKAYHLSSLSGMNNKSSRSRFGEGFFNTYLPNLEISKLISDDSSTSSSSSSSHVSSSSGNIPKTIDLTISRVNTNPNSTTLETGDYSTFQSHVMCIIRIQKTSTA
ncbi:hypothetical protein ACTFIR_007489 [Dictyostelium discoideum]